jgi:predicted acylesterase/phospholipase RssA
VESRFNSINEPHISLALEGGGAKGVGYVGVYKQLAKLSEFVR